MTDYTGERIFAECEECKCEVSTQCARAIAGLWHGGQWTALYAFASSGNYDREALMQENSDNIKQSYGAGDLVERAMLDMLGTYLINRKS